MAVHSSILAWRIPWTGEPWQAAVHGVAKESDMTEQLTLTHSHCAKSRILKGPMKLVLMLPP